MAGAASRLKHQAGDLVQVVLVFRLEGDGAAVATAGTAGHMRL